MKIAVDAREFSTSTGRYIRKLLEYLEKVDENSEHNYVIMLKSEDYNKYQPKAKNFSKVKADFKEFTFVEQVSFLRFCRNLKVDLIHFAMVQQPVLYKGATVTTMQDLTTLRFLNPVKNPAVMKFKQKIYAWVNKQVAKKSNQIIVPTNFVKQDIIDFTHADSKKITVTYESADKIIEEPEPIRQLVNKDFIMYVGQPFSHKNLRRLIDAFVILQKSQPSLHLVLAGKLNEVYKIHVRYVKKIGLKNVVFTDFVSEGQLRWLYENCQAYIFPSLSEGFGLPGLEAMAHGAPVVSSNATCLPEVYGEAAYYFDPLSIEDMAEKINDVLGSTQLRESLIKKGSVQVQKYSWAKMAKQTLAVYAKALKH